MNDLYQWLDDHPLINIAGMCRNLGINQGNFVTYRNEKKLPPEMIERVKEYLKAYGYSEKPAKKSYLAQRQENKLK